MSVSSLWYCSWLSTTRPQAPDAAGEDRGLKEAFSSPWDRAVPGTNELSSSKVGTSSGRWHLKTWFAKMAHPCASSFNEDAAQFGPRRRTTTYLVSTEDGVGAKSRQKSDPETRNFL